MIAALALALTVTTADGKKVEKEDALKKLAGGAVVVVSADGKPVSPAFLKVFKDDTLVLSSPELVGPATGARPQPVPLPAGNIQLVPLQGGGGIQVQIQGGVVPAKPAPAEKPEK